jgi:hypothetical protein
MSWLATLQEAAEADWSGVTLQALPGAGLFALSRDRWGRVLDGANPVSHEAGHPLLGVISGHVAAHGGTLAQLRPPIPVAAAFGLRRAAVPFAFALLWLIETLWNVVRYIADARSQALLLVVGGEHDRTEILARRGALHLDTTLAGTVHALGGLGALGVLGWLAWRWHDDRRYLD